jgi:hypothetical protein
MEDYYDSAFYFHAGIFQVGVRCLRSEEVRWEEVR